MYAQLGNIVFENCIGFSTYEITGSEKYAEHALINLYPRLEHTGTDLRVLKFDMRFHANYCVPEDQSAALWAAKNTAAILTLVFGNGKIIGDFVITEITENLTATLPDGTYIEMVASVQLKECVLPDKQNQDQQNATSNAAAVKSKAPDPLRKFPPQYPSSVGALTNALLRAVWLAAEIEYLVTIAAANPSQFLLASMEAQFYLTDLGDTMDDIESIVTPAYQAAEEVGAAYVDWSTENTNITNNATIVRTSSDAYISTLPLTSMNIVSAQAAAATLKTQCATLAASGNNTIIQHTLRKV